MLSVLKQPETNLVGQLRSQSKVFWIAALGLALESCAGQFGRLTSTTLQNFGLAPSLVSPALSIAVALVVLLCARAGKRAVFGNRALSIVVALLFSVALVAYYLCDLVYPCPDWAVITLYLATSAIGVVYLYLWYDRILTFGQMSALFLVGVGLVFRALLQCTTFFLLPEFSTGLLTLMPALSLPCLLMVDAHLKATAENPEGTVQRDELRIFPENLSLSRTILYALLVVFFLVSLLNALAGQTKNSGIQADMGATEYRILLIAANVFAGLLLAVISRFRAGVPALYLFVILTIALSCLSVFSDSSLGKGAQAVYALSSQISSRLTDFLLVFVAFMFTRNKEKGSLGLYAVGRAVISLSTIAGLLIRAAATTMGPGLATVAQSIVFAGLFAAIVVFFLGFDRSSSHSAAANTTGATHPADGNNPTTEDLAEEKAPEGTEPEAPVDEFMVACEALAKEARLTPTETNVLRLVARGKNAESASKDLVVSVNTVRTHIRNIYVKLSVHSQQELIALVEDHVASSQDN